MPNIKGSLSLKGVIWLFKKWDEVSKAALLGSIIIKYSDKDKRPTARNRLELIEGSVISPKNGTCSRNNAMI